MIPDDNPGNSEYVTIRELHDMLVNDYGADSGDPANRLPEHEVDQAMAALKEHKCLVLPYAGLIFVEEGVGLYACYEMGSTSDE